MTEDKKVVGEPVEETVVEPAPAIPARWQKAYDLAEQHKLGAETASLLLRDVIEELGKVEQDIAELDALRD